MSGLAETGEQSAPQSPARRLAAAAAIDVPLLLVFAALVAEPSTRDFALVNLLVQAVLFVFGACLPAHRTRLMAFVDGIWPWGLTAVGVQALLFGDTGSPVLLVVAGAYLAMGLRGGIWAAIVGFTTRRREDLPRYRYRRMVWKQAGYRSTTLPMQHEILQQGFCNVSVLAVPAMLAVAHGEAEGGPLLVAGGLLWAAGFALESLADVQKSRFAKTHEGETCDTGLWRYSRHPNYFFQWVQWHGLILAVLPSLFELSDDFALLPWVGAAAGLAGAAAGMYYVLVHYTGAIPAEHFSSQHRPGYREYQQQVNRFVPGPSRRPRTATRSASPPTAAATPRPDRPGRTRTGSR